MSTITENPVTVNSIPRIGDAAPDFTALTTVGSLNFYDFKKDSYAILFSHPADFTPVCTTELIEFAREKDFFAARNTKLIGVSIDSIHSHVAWVQNVREKTGVYLDFPIVADLDTKVAQAYGMIHPGESQTATVRAVFVIDPSNKIRTIIYYPLNIGRNLDEIKRVIEALQTADKHSVALPANWRPGDKVIVPPPKTLSEVEERVANTSYEKVDFYLSKKDLV